MFCLSENFTKIGKFLLLILPYSEKPVDALISRPHHPSHKKCFFKVMIQELKKKHYK